MSLFTRHSFFAWIVLHMALPLSLPAQPASPHTKSPIKKTILFEHITVDQGLSQTSVNAIFQDQQGFVWIGTSDGLNKYDGYEVTIYRHDPDNANSLPANDIGTIYEAPSEPGVLWIGTRTSGLVRFDRELGVFTTYAKPSSDSTRLISNHITALLEDRRGTFWVGTMEGLVQMDRTAETFTIYKDEYELPQILSEESISTLYEGRSGELWIGTYRKGLSRFDPASQTFSHYAHFADDPNSLSDNRITAIQEDGRGNMWVGTGKGLNQWDAESDTFVRYLTDPGNPHSLSGNFVTDIGHVEAEPGILWIGTISQGLNRLNTDTGMFSAYLHDGSDPKGLPDNRIRALYGDRSGVLWVGSLLGGVSRTNGAFGTFMHYTHDADDPNSLSESMVWSIVEDRDGDVWVGTNSRGLNRIDRSTGMVTRYLHDPEDERTISHNAIRSLLEDSNGTLWVGSANGIDAYDRETDTFIPRQDMLDIPPPYEDSYYVSKMFEDSRGRIWIGMMGALIRYDPAKGTSKHFYHQPDDPHSLSDPRIMAIYEAGDGTLWVGTWNGLNRFVPEKNGFIHYTYDRDNPNSLSNNTVLAIAEDRSGCLWVGTAGGLNRVSTSDEQIERFTQQNSDLPTNTINGILAGDDGNLWISTHNGLARFNPVTRTFHTYGVERGLQSVEFNGGAYHKADSGELFFGGINGLNTFYPDEIKDNSYPPQVALTDLKIWSKPVEPDNLSMLREHISMAHSLILAHDQNDVTFDYVGLHYAAPEKNTYAYKLEGFDEEWRWVGKRRSAIYTNIPPGEYTFRARAANSDGVWNEQGASIALTINPPWWRTNWAYMLYVLSMIAAVFVVDRVQRDRVISKERERSRIREMELQAQAAEAQATALRIENERQTRELEEARHLQLSMLPESMPQHPTVELAASMKTATEVGGDYYDFFLDEDSGQLTIAIGDATGHGANAGTMVTATKALFNVLARESDPVYMLDASSQALRRMGFRKLFMALALARLRGNTLELAGAGMPPALLFRARTREIETLSLKGIPLGGPGAIGYQKQAVDVEPGDTVMLMSDGFPELFRKSGEMLGYEKAVEVFRDIADRSPAEILAHFEQTGKRWLDGEPPGDDITFVVMKVKNP